MIPTETSSRTGQAGQNTVSGSVPSGPAGGGAVAVPSRRKKPAAGPTRLFQFWNTSEPPAEVAALLSTWEDDPAFSYARFTTEAADAYIDKHFDPAILAAFRDCAIPAMQADFFRYCALYREGGIYVDADTSNSGKLTGLIQPASRGALMVRHKNIANDFLFIRDAADPLIEAVLMQAVQNIQSRFSENVWLVTGPGIFHMLRAQPQNEALFEGFDYHPVHRVRRFMRFEPKMEYKGGADDWRHGRKTGRPKIEIYKNPAPLAETVDCQKIRATTTFAESVKPKEIRNEVEIQLIGPQRSGNHAVVAWILQQYDEPIVFLNNVAHFEDPYLNFRIGKVAGAARVSKAKPAHQERLRRQKKPLLIYSYENLKLEHVSSTPLVPNHDEVIGPSEKVSRILLLRDFFNWAASRIRLKEYRNQDTAPLIADFSPLIKLWLNYAREFAGDTDYLADEHVVKISYPRWTKDAEYRAWILGQLHVPLKDNRNDKVPDVGGGSSFDKDSFSGSGSQMKTDERWHYLLEPRFAPIRATIEAHREKIESYNYSLFGVEWPDLSTGDEKPGSDEA